MKAILMAGGLGTRFGDCAKVVSKHLLPVYDKPLIYYPLEFLARIGIEDVAIIVSCRNLFEKLLGDGSMFGLNIQYFIQYEPKGVAQAFTICKDFIDGDVVCLALGDNIFLGEEIEFFSKWCLKILDKNLDKNNAIIVTCESDQASKYGVVTLGQPVIGGQCPLRLFLSGALEEKPSIPKTNLIVPGLYFIGGSAVARVENMKPSVRGELEITDLLNSFVVSGQVLVGSLTKETVWFDIGNCDNLLAASNYIHQGRCSA